MKTNNAKLNGIYIRKSANPLKKTSYAVYFRQGDSWIGRFVTDNGNIVDLGHIINNFLNHESVPMDMEKYEHKVEVKEVDMPEPEKKHTFQTIMKDALEGLKNVPTKPKETGDSSWINFSQLSEMLAKNSIPQMEWKPVSESFDRSKYEMFTLVRIENWVQRYGFACNYNGAWDINIVDTAIAAEKSAARITHWLAIPLSLRKSMDNTKVC